MTGGNKMSYGSFVFEPLPSKIEITTERKIAEQKIPNGNNTVWDFGDNGRTIKGEGEFFGANALEQFERLREVVQSGGSHALYLPSFGRITAVCSSLKLLEEDHDNAVAYSFVFREVCTAAVNDWKQSTAVLEGECLWQIATRTEIAVEVLLKLNPQIARPDRVLTTGERIVLR
ncbi:MAG: DNA circularization N-terminal domain-containing protein [Acutalibacteraceae bacterium]